MAHWAKINEQNIVEHVIVTSNDEPDEGEAWIAENLEGMWIKTSYNTVKGKHLLGGVPLRKNFAGIGFSYNPELDAFVPPKGLHEADFILDTETATWVPPLSFPEDADFVLGFGKEPEMVQKEVVVNGEKTMAMIRDIPIGSKAYYWIYEESAWGMLPNVPKPEGNFTWDPIAKEWIEVPAPPEASNTPEVIS